MNAMIRHNYAGIYVIQQNGVYSLYQGSILLARTDNSAIADKLFFKLSLEIASTRIGGGARAQLTAEGRKAFGCEGVSSLPEGDKTGDNPSTAGAVPLPLHKGGEAGDSSEGGVEDKPKRKVFKKPTVEEITEYCRERAYALTDPQAFYDYHESGGWMVGRNKMKDWKAAVRTWEHKEKERQAERAAREKRYGRSRKGVELTNPEICGLHLDEFEQDLMKYLPKFKPTERNEVG